MSFPSRVKDNSFLFNLIIIMIIISFSSSSSSSSIIKIDTLQNDSLKLSDKYIKWFSAEEILKQTMFVICVFNFIQNVAL